MAEADALIRLGVLASPFGNDGGIRCRTDSDSVTNLVLPCDAFVGYSLAYAHPAGLLEFRRHGRDLIFYFRDVTDKGSAAAMQDKAVFVPRSVIQYADVYSDPDLTGLLVKDTAGKELGHLKSVFRTAAHTVWVIAGSDGQEHMIPAVPEFIKEIDTDRSVAVVCPIPGMFDEAPAQKSSDGDDDDGNDY